MRARDAVANDLAACGISVRVQRSFRQEHDAETLLAKLNNYIGECSVVICIIGSRSGSYPTAVEAEQFSHMLPPGFEEASYTQWELIFARHYKRRLLLFFASEDYAPDQPEHNVPEKQNQQWRFVDYLISLGLDRNVVSNRDQIRAEVMKQQWREATVTELGAGNIDTERLSWLSSELMSNESWRVKRAIIALKREGSPIFLQTLRALINKGDKDIAFAAMMAASEINSRDTIEIFSCGLASEIKEIVLSAIFFIGEFALFKDAQKACAKMHQLIDMLFEATIDDNKRIELVHTISKIGGQDAFDALVAILKSVDANPELKARALHGPGRFWSKAHHAEFETEARAAISQWTADTCKAVSQTAIFGFIREPIRSMVVDRIPRQRRSLPS